MRLVRLGVPKYFMPRHVLDILDFDNKNQIMCRLTRHAMPLIECVLNPILNHQLRQMMNQPCAIRMLDRSLLDRDLLLVLVI